MLYSSALRGPMHVSCRAFYWYCSLKSRIESNVCRRRQSGRARSGQLAAEYGGREFVRDGALARFPRPQVELHAAQRGLARRPRASALATSLLLPPPKKTHALKRKHQSSFNLIRMQLLHHEVIAEAQHRKFANSEASNV